MNEQERKMNVGFNPVCLIRGCNRCDNYYNELQQYNELGTVEELREALEKQVGKKIISVEPLAGDVKVGHLNFKAGCKLYKCPVCGAFLSNDVYCRNCGQKLEQED